jgi:hypothetical protein
MFADTRTALEVVMASAAIGALIAWFWITTHEGRK